MNKTAEEKKRQEFLENIKKCDMAELQVLATIASAFKMKRELKKCGA